MTGNENGDLTLAIRAMINVVELSDPPLRLPVGLNTMPRIIQKLTSDIEAYKKVETLWKATNSLEQSPKARSQVQPEVHA